MEHREALFRRINGALERLYWLLGAALSVIHAMRGDGLFLALSLPVPFVPVLLRRAYGMLKLRMPQQLNFWILLFMLLSYPLGCCAWGYQLLWWYDKAVHMLSGSFVGLVSLAVFYRLKPGHAIERRDCALALVFLFLAAAASAGLWELAEYGMYAATGIDVQSVMTTGVGDTMGDMAVCLLGAAAVMPAARRMCLGRRNLLGDSIHAFIDINR